MSKVKRKGKLKGKSVSDKMYRQGRTDEHGLWISDFQPELPSKWWDRFKPLEQHRLDMHLRRLAWEIKWPSSGDAGTYIILSDLSSLLADHKRLTMENKKMTKKLRRLQDGS